MRQHVQCTWHRWGLNGGRSLHPEMPLFLYCAGALPVLPWSLIHAFAFGDFLSLSPFVLHRLSFHLSPVQGSCSRNSYLPSPLFPCRCFPSILLSPSMPVQGSYSRNAYLPSSMSPCWCFPGEFRLRFLPKSISCPSFCECDIMVQGKCSLDFNVSLLLPSLP